MTVRIVKYILFMTLLFFIQCKSVQLLSYKDTETIKGNTLRETTIKNKIDRGKTFAKTFILKNNEKCIKIKINSHLFDKSIEKKINIKTFFIIEKLIDLSNFSDSDKKYDYSEISKNYDYNWNTKSEVEICSSENPIDKLNKDNIFRIRFTTFNEQNFEYSITIQSENGINLKNN